MAATHITLLPAECLPASDQDLLRFCRHWWPDKMVTILDKSRESVKLRFDWPSVYDLRKDPRILEGVTRLFPRWSGNHIAELHSYFGETFVCLNDSWTLLEWSRVARFHALSRPIIVHVDAHSDLMSPMLRYSGTGLEDLFTGALYGIRNEDQVLSAIRSGAIGIGSFLLPFISEIPCHSIIHICPASYCPDIRGARFARTSKIFAEPFVKQPRIGLDWCNTRLLDAIPFFLSEISGLPEIDLGDHDVLLHIDLDFFNNRINGDSHWFENPLRHDPSLEEALSAVRHLSRALRNRGLQKARSVVIACSPEFCPAEFWQPLIEELQRYFL